MKAKRKHSIWTILNTDTGKDQARDQMTMSEATEKKRPKN